MHIGFLAAMLVIAGVSFIEWLAPKLPWWLCLVLVVLVFILFAH